MKKKSREITEIFLKEGEVKKIQVADADVKSYTSDNKFFVLKKKDEHCYLVPADNIYLVHSYETEVEE